MVELMGVGPTTSSMPRKRSPTELQPHVDVRILYNIGASKTIVVVVLNGSDNRALIQQAFSKGGYVQH